MNYLFVHQGFPGQYKHIVARLSKDPSNTIVALGISPLNFPLPSNVHYIQYPIHRANTSGLHEWLLDFDSKFIRGEACANAAHQLRQNGFNPDLICAHPGWGETLFLSDIWPEAPILCYQEFFYNPTGYDYDFDPEHQSADNWDRTAKLRLKNASPLLSLHNSCWNVTPTYFQKSSFPAEYHHKISVIHDGIDTDICKPSSDLQPLQLSDGFTINKTTTIVTFVNRTFEPYRGFHTFMRAIPSILASTPDVHIVLVGHTEGVSYGKAPSSGTWKSNLLAEIDGSFDPSRVHFTGPLDYSTYLHVLSLSSCHVYLTYPFVLSWSLLEAMSFALPIVASSTSPVIELIQDKSTGLLVDFFSASSLAESVSTLLSDRSFAKSIGANARHHIASNYKVDDCVSRHLDLMNLVASHSLSH